MDAAQKIHEGRRFPISGQFYFIPRMGKKIKKFNWAFE